MTTQPTDSRLEVAAKALMVEVGHALCCGHPDGLCEPCRDGLKMANEDLAAALNELNAGKDGA